ncbi:hypothetical protein MMYC01_202385 [Madurella mycetomatis]|uniref:Kinetochore protein fta7 n=1 Tax=Madurella mycetomatis TaxID=100816 RepID=A0A175W8Q2_9PEZI|nr:hypothetical protein MMYC01_202385 [Madurella mycetomatis]
MAPGGPNQKRRRGRLPSASKAAESALSEPRDAAAQGPAGKKSAEADSAPKKRGRSRKSDVGLQEEAASAQASHVGERSALAPKKRGRLPKARDTEVNDEEATEARPRKRLRREKAGVTETGEGEGEGSRRSNRNKPEEEGEERESAQAPGPTPEPVTKYRHLTSRTRQIPRSTITAKWTPLPPEAVSSVSAIVTDTTRPVLLRLSDRSDARHAQAQTILRTFSSRLHTKLVKGMPFPPPISGVSSAKSRKKAGEGAGHETELDFEKTVDAIGRLERALNPLLHSVALLKAEKEREEQELEKDYKLLRRLEGNAKAERKEWRERGKRGHVLAGGLGTGGAADGEGGEEERGLEIVKKGKGRRVLVDLQEEELLALSQQIGSHMESMRSNLGQIEGVLPAIAKSRAALQAALCRHLEPEQYDQVLLG